jgi:hypothetical protein
VDDSEKLRGEVACRLIPPDIVRKSLEPRIEQAIFGALREVAGHPEWNGMLHQAVSEEVDATEPELCLSLGRWITRGLTPDQSHATLAFLTTPDGEALRQVLGAGIAHQQRPDLSPATTTQINRFFASTAGRQILDNLKDSAQLGRVSGDSYGVLITPGIFRRFGEKVSQAGP